MLLIFPLKRKHNLYIMSILKKSTKSLIIGGLFFSVPFVIGIVFWNNFYTTIKPIAKTISESVKLSQFLGPYAILFVCIVLLLIFCYIGGILIKKGILKKWSAKFEKKLFIFFPTLQIIKFRAIGEDSSIINEFWQGIVFKEDNHYKVGFITEKTNTFITIYIPDAPKLDTGEIRYIETQHFDHHHISMKQAMSAIYNFGEGLNIENIILNNNTK